MDGCWIDACRARWAVGAVAASLLLLAPAAAHAAAAPRITNGPVIGGTPQVGAELDAAALWTGDPQPVASWAWQRCPKASGSCTLIAGATAARYRVMAGDANSFLRVRLTLKNEAGTAEARSKPTAMVTVAPVPTATPTPTVTATPAPTPEATLEPTASPEGVAVPAAPPPEPVAALPAAASPSPQAVALRLHPFPVVRIKGLLTATGARVTLLSVRAPRSARITVLCRGHDCPTRRFTAPAGTRRLRRFERRLRAGTRLEVRVTMPGYIGKDTVIVIRRQAAPSRADRCLNPDSIRPVRCA